MLRGIQRRIERSRTKATKAATWPQRTDLSTLMFLVPYTNTSLTMHSTVKRMSQEALPFHTDHQCLSNVVGLMVSDHQTLGTAFSMKDKAQNKQQELTQNESFSLAKAVRKRCSWRNKESYQGKSWITLTHQESHNKYCRQRGLSNSDVLTTLEAGSLRSTFGMVVSFAASLVGFLVCVCILGTSLCAQISST